MLLHVTITIYGKMESKKRVGRKRKFEKLLDELQENPSVPRKEPNASIKTDTPAADTVMSYQANEATDRAVSDNGARGLSMVHVVLGQALNLVPPCFKDKRMQYLANIVSASGFTTGDLNIKDLEVKVQQLEQLGLGDSISLFGLPNINLLWNATFDTKVPHTLFLGPPPLLIV